MSIRLGQDFFQQGAHEVAGALLGCRICVASANGEISKLTIVETEVYCGEEDTACHAHKGRTKRTEPLYMQGGIIYVYLCYGIHWLINIVTGATGRPECVLIRACEGFLGPGRLTKHLGIDKRFNLRSIAKDHEIWIEQPNCHNQQTAKILQKERVGIAYASEKDRQSKWRYVLTKCAETNSRANDIKSRNAQINSAQAIVTIRGEENEKA